MKANRPKNYIYGETTFKGMLQLFKDIEQHGVTKNDIFLDIGSGYGKLVKSAASYFDIKSYGIEIDVDKHKIARTINNLGRPKIELICGDYRDHMEIVNESTIIFCNVIMFDEELVKPLFKNITSRNNVICYHNNRWLMSKETINIDSTWSEKCRYYKINTKQRG